MTVNEAKHQAKLAEWKERILDCRSQGIPVAEWCAQHGCHKTTYYKWEREIFGKLAALNNEPHSKHMECIVPVMPASQPEFAELSIAAPGPLARTEDTPLKKFEPVAMIRIGKVELELSNSVSGNLMRQLKGLMSLAE